MMTWAIYIAVLTAISVVVVILVVKRSSSVQSEFDAIKDEWAQSFKAYPLYKEVRWSDEEPMIRQIDGLDYMFKHVTVVGKTAEGRITISGYSVARRDADGRWVPTAIILVVDSVDEAAAEIKKDLMEVEEQ